MWKHFHCKFSDLSFSLGYYLQVKSPVLSIVDTPVTVYERYPESRKYGSARWKAHRSVLSWRRLSETFPPRENADFNAGALQFQRFSVRPTLGVGFCSRGCFPWIQMFRWISLRTWRKPCKFLCVIPCSQFMLQREWRSSPRCFVPNCPLHNAHLFFCKAKYIEGKVLAKSDSIFQSDPREAGILECFSPCFTFVYAVILIRYFFYISLHLCMYSNLRIRVVLKNTKFVMILKEFKNIPKTCINFTCKWVQKTFWKFLINIVLNK